MSGDAFAPRIQIFAPDGESLGIITSPPRLDLILPAVGTYTAIVFNHFVTNAGPGQYTFTVACTGGSCLPPPGKLPAKICGQSSCSTSN